MTISTTTIKNSYSANSSTVTFNYTFKIAADTEIEVIIRASDGTETIKSKGTHYNVTGVGNAGGGSVTFVAQHTPQTNETVVLRRVTPLTQGLDLIENDPMPAENIETAYDKLTAISQELQEQLDRSIKVSKTSTISNPEITSDASQRAGKLLGFDSSGNLDSTIDGTAVAANATAAANSATQAASSATNAAASALQAQNVAGGGTVKITSNDTTAGLLNDKLAVAGSLTKTTLNAGGNEQVQLSVAGGAEVYGFVKSYSPVTLNYAVTVVSSGGNKYAINGTTQATVDLKEGDTVQFDMSDSSVDGHPLKLSTTSNGSHGGGSTYSTNVTYLLDGTSVSEANYYNTTNFNAASSRILKIVVASGAPTLYYFCHYHSGMGGQLNTLIPVDNLLQVTTTNGGQDSITNTQYAAFDDVLLSAIGFTFSLNASGNLIATI